jgi:hypothetical protein
MGRLNIHLEFNTDRRALANGTEYLPAVSWIVGA